jgi:predicted membrane protein
MGEDMQAIRFLPTKVHGVLDYLVGIALILAPNIFQFSEVGGAAVFVPRVLGVVLILYSLLTRYEWGVLKLVPMSYHLTIDFAAAVFLAASPFIFGFVSLKPNAWVPHVAVGVIVILVVLVSQTQPGRSTTTPVATSQ